MTSPVRGKVTVEVIADTRRFAGQLERQLRTALRRIRIAPDPDIDDTNIRRAGDRVSKSFTQSVAKGLGKLGSALGGAVGGLSKLMAGFGAVGAIGLFTSSMLSATAATFSFVGSLGPMVGILAVLPGLMTSLGIAVGVVALGFEDLKKVVTEATEDALEELRKIAGQNLTKGLEDGVKRLVTAWMPMLRTQTKQLSQSLNEMLLFTLKFAATKSVVADWGTVMKNTNQGLMIMKTVLAQVFSAFTDLAVIGSDFFPRMSSAIDNSTYRFAEWISTARNSGAATAWIEAAIVAFRQLGEIFRQLGGILGAIFKVAGVESDTLLARVGALLKEVNAFLSGAEGTSALVTIFGTARILTDALHESFRILGGAIVDSVIPAVASVAQALAGVLPTIATALGQGLAALAPAIAPLANALAAILAAVAPLLPLVGQLAAVFAGALTSALGVILPVIQQIVTALVSSLTPVLPALTSLFAQLAAGMAPIAGMLGGLIAQAIQMLVPIILQLVQAIAPLAQQLLGLLVQALGMILPPIMELIPVIASALIPVIESLMGAFIQILEAILPLIPPIMELIAAIVPLIPMIADLAITLINALLPAIIPIIEIIVTLATTILGVLTPVLSFLVNYIIGPVIGALGAIIGWLGKVIGAVVGFVADFLKYITEIPGKVKSAFSDAGSWLMDAGRKIVQGLINGIKAMIGSVKDALGSVTKLIPSWKGPEDVDRRLLVPAGQAIMGGLETGIESQRKSLRRLLGEVTKDVNLPGTMIGARGGDGASMDAPIAVDNYIQIGEEVVRVVRSEIRASNRQLVRAARSGSRSGEVIV